MEGGQIGAFAAQFAVMLSLSIGWLIICRVLRGLRMKIHVTFAYLVAAAIALAACLLSGPTWFGAAASLLVMLLLYLRWKRSLKMQSLDANTIIGFDTHVIR